MRALAGRPPPADVLLPATFTDKGGHLFSVRELRSEDRATLESFYDDFNPKRAAQGLPPEGPARVARWLDGILPEGKHLVVEREGRMIGHAMLMPTQKEGTREYAIFLSQDVRGQGVGTQVNRLSVEVARAMDIDRLWLSVEPHNRPALRSYEKAGFRFRPGTIYSPEVEMEMELQASDPPLAAGPVVSP